MNTSKQINIMVVLVFLTLVAFGAYAIWEPTRADEAAELQEEKTAEFGAKIFAQNCRLCHGDRGEGGAAGGRLPEAVPLDRPDLQGFIRTDLRLAAAVGVSDRAVTVDAEARFENGDVLLIDKERMVVISVEGNLISVERAFAGTEAAEHAAEAQVLVLDEAKLRENAHLVTDTITCGRVGTAMPLWGETQGGPLNSEQIRQLTVLITTGRWGLVQEFVEHADATGIHLTEAVSATDRELPLESTSGFKAGNPIRIDEERMLIQEVKETSLVVERGALATEAAAHEAGAEVFNQPPPLQTPAILQTACGQFIRGPVPTTAPAATPTAGPGTVLPTAEATATPSAAPAGAQEVTIKAIPSIQFDTDEIRVKPGAITVRFANEDTGVPHNFAVYTDSSAKEAIAGANENICNAPCEADITFEISEPGTYYFRCDVHPFMEGDLIVEE